MNTLNLNESEIVREYLEDGFPKDIAIKHGCSSVTVNQIAKKYGVTRTREENSRLVMRKKSGNIYNEDAMISDYVDGKMFAEDVAEKYGCSVSMVNKIMREHGVVRTAPESRALAAKRRIKKREGYKHKGILISKTPENNLAMRAWV